jgi:hypothetical protein
MIPKVGDIVNINPLYKAAESKKYNSRFRMNLPKNWFGEEEDGHIHVLGVVDRTSYYVIKIGLGWSYVINLKGTTDFNELDAFGWFRDAQLFVPVGMKKKDSILDLKSLNTQPDSTNCAGCNGLLKDPGMGPRFKYCPKCEP